MVKPPDQEDCNLSCGLESPSGSISGACIGSLQSFSACVAQCYFGSTDPAVANERVTEVCLFVASTSSTSSGGEFASVSAVSVTPAPSVTPSEVNTMAVDDSSGSNSKTPIAAIVGGAVGGVVLLLAIFLLGYFCAVLRKRRAAGEKDAEASELQDTQRYGKLAEVDGGNAKCEGEIAAVNHDPIEAGYGNEKFEAVGDLGGKEMDAVNREPVELG